MRRLATEAGYDLAECWAYSDSRTDLPMLAAVGHPVAVNPDRALRREAARRGWQTGDFVNPVPLRSVLTGRLGEPRQRVAAAAALGAGAAGLAWYAGRRRARRPDRALPKRGREE